MKVFPKTPCNEVRIAKRASYQWPDISRIIDDIAIGHVSFLQDGRPFAIPLNVWRMGEHLYLHCLKGGRLSKVLPSQDSCCISFAEHNAWVLSKSAYHTSANYRSVVAHGHFSLVNDPREFEESFKVLLNSIEPDRWNKVRQLSKKEIQVTHLLKFEIESASAKSRTGKAVEEETDLSLPVTAGILPIIFSQGEIEETY